MKNLFILLFCMIVTGLFLNSCKQETDLMNSANSESDDVNLGLKRAEVKAKPERTKDGGTSFVILQLLPGAQQGSARSINNNGEIVGYSDMSGYRQPTYWSSFSAAPEDLGLPEGISYGYASSINDAGYIVGSTGEIQSNSTALKFRPGTPAKLEHLLGAGLAYAWEVNNSGFISG